MPDWNVEISGTFNAKTAEEATQKLLDLFLELQKGENVKEQLEGEERFNYSANVNEYA